MEFEINNDKIYIKYFHYEVSEDIWPTMSQLQELQSETIASFLDFDTQEYLNIKVTDFESKYILDYRQKYLLTIFLKVFLDNYHRMKDKESLTESWDTSSFEDNIDEPDGQNRDLTPDGQNSDLTPDDQNTDSITDDQNTDLTKNDQNTDLTKNENGDLITNDTQYTKFNCKIDPNNLKIDKTKLKSTIKIKQIEYKSHIIPQILIANLLIIFPLTLLILVIKIINKYHINDIIYHSPKKF